MSNNLRTRNGVPFNFVNGLKVRGVDIESLIPGIEGIPEAGTKYQFAGNGVQTAFTLPVTPYNKDAVEAHVKQLYVHSTDYSLVGDQVIFTEAPPGLDAGETYNIEIKVNLTVLNGYVNANRVSFEGENLDDILEKSKTLANYSNLRSYGGAATHVRITDPGIAGFFYYDASDTTSVDNGGTVIVAGSNRWKRVFDGPVSVKWFGAKGDGITNDTSAINLATLTVYNEGGGVVYFPNRGNYKVGRRVSGSQEAAIKIYAGVSLDGGGSTITLVDNCGYIDNGQNWTSRATITGDVVKGDTQLTVATTENLVAGDVVGIRLGNNEWDVVETRRFFFAKVKSIDSSTLVTIDRPSPEAMVVSTTATQNRRFWRFRKSDGTELYENTFIKNFYFIQGAGGNSEQCIWLHSCRNVRIENIYAENPGAGIVLASYCENITLDGVSVPESIQQSGQASKGRAINLVNCDTVICNNLNVTAFQGEAIFVESYCRNITFNGTKLNNNWLAAKGTSRGTTALMLIGQGSSVHFNDLFITGRGTGESVYESGGTSNLVTFENYELDTAQTPKFGFEFFGWVGGYLKVAGYTLRYSSIKRVSYDISVNSSLSDWNPGVTPPNGFIVAGWYSRNDPAINQLYIVRSSDSSAQWSVTSMGTVNERISFLNTGSGYGTDYPSNVVGNRGFRLYTGSVNAGAKLRVEFLFVPYINNDGTNARTHIVV